ncbi:hypothetical protein EASAB2608_05207 [Streptomyces sp. EAS-AB2608]|uniref:Uncharacterized protein n=1 Tax=Streptomyces bangladeshensis TaxID=295352 RepID=A0ABN1ZJ39_9ACTN|nr:hypothetical protein EASAB2608_05207 [Streptomyces sp. EAS-AB2608]
MRLAYEALGEAGVVREFGTQHLDGGEHTGAVLADVDLAHSALAEDAEQTVGAESDRIAGAEGFHAGVGPSDERGRAAVSGQLREAVRRGGLSGGPPVVT